MVKHKTKSKAKKPTRAAREDLLDRLHWATMWVHQGDAADDAAVAAANAVDRVVAGLRRDQRFPKMPSADWDLVTADACNLIASDLRKVISDAADYSGVINAIADELLGEELT